MISFSQPLNVLNNYFSVGIDAHIALQFHRARNNNPNHFTSRTRNLLFYGLEVRPFSFTLLSIIEICKKRRLDRAAKTFSSNNGGT